MKKNSARRYIEGKLRLGLIPHYATSKIAEVFTRGSHKHTLFKDDSGNIISGKDIPFEDAHKYEIHESGDDNWRSGLSWSKTLESAKRHIMAFETGEDIDEELKTLHLANAAWNMIVLLEFYKIHPQGDDRHHAYLNRPKIGLDIDEVICNFVKGWHEKTGADPSPQWWNYHRGMGNEFNKMREEGTLDEFYLSLEPKIKPSEIPFEPTCYVTSRPVDSSITEKWLDMHGFPIAKVITIPMGASKVDVIKESGIEIFVDDRFDNFVELNKAGICCYLFDAPHNQRYKVGHKRIKSLTELTF